MGLITAVLLWRQLLWAGHSTRADNKGGFDDVAEDQALKIGLEIRDLEGFWCQLLKE